jgi:pyrroloquinoline quinone biosynthesis protein D
MKAQTSIAAKCIPRLPRGVRLRFDHVRQRWVLLAPERIFELDEVGVEILKHCDGSLSFEEIIGALADAFGTSRDEVRPDIEAFLMEFANRRVIDL